MGVTNTEWLAFAAALISVVVGTVQVRYWWASSSREAAERERIRAAAAVAKKEIEDAAEAARRIVQTTARKDALAEWQKLYGEKDREVDELRTQNHAQQQELDTLKVQHEDCERRHAELESKVSELSGTVTKIANGH